MVLPTTSCVWTPVATSIGSTLIPANSSSISAAADDDDAVDWTSAWDVQGTCTKLKSRSTSPRLIVVVVVDESAAGVQSPWAEVDGEGSVVTGTAGGLEVDAGATTTALVVDGGSHVNACICQSNTEASISGVTFCGVSGVTGVIGHGVSPLAAEAEGPRIADGRSHGVESGCSRSTASLSAPAPPLVVVVDAAVVCRQVAGSVDKHCLSVTGASDADDVSDDVTIEAATHTHTHTSNRKGTL